MAKQAVNKIKESEDSTIIDEYKELNDKLDSVLEKISKKQNKKSKK